MSILLGCIADDFTGATDIAGILARSNVPVNLRLGIPGESITDKSNIDESDTHDTPAPFEIIALKCRASPVEEAIAETSRAWNWLALHGAKRGFWKYCSTFDSTETGNIGPVSEALLSLMDDSKNPMTIYCPAFPENGRSIYMSNLFIGEQLLSESPMKDHPLTPMRDSNLCRLLTPQVHGKVGALTWPTIRKGSQAIEDGLRALAADGVMHVVVDAVDSDDLLSIVRGSEHLTLLTGGSALALHLPALFRIRGWLTSEDQAAPIPAPEGGRLVLSGSCSAMTQQQVAAFKSTCQSFQLEPLALARDNQLESARSWLAEQNSASHNHPAMIYATAPAEAITRAQNELGRKAAGEIVEKALATLATDAFDQGVRQYVVAGGETAGAVSQALGLSRLRVGREIAPGVPWTYAIRKAKPVALALKSGNFGSSAFFEEAFTLLNTPERF